MSPENINMIFICYKLTMKILVIPVLKCFLAFLTPTRQGNPYSLATTAPVYNRVFIKFDLCNYFIFFYAYREILYHRSP